MRNCNKAGRRNVLELTKAMNNAFAEFESHVVTFDRQRPSLGSEQHKDVITHMQSLQWEVKKVKEPVNWSSQMQNLYRCPETHYRQAPGRRERARACTPIYKHKGIFKWATPSRSDRGCVSVHYVNLYNTNIKYSRFKYSRRKVTNIWLITYCVYRHRTDLDINFLSWSGVCRIVAHIWPYSRVFSLLFHAWNNLFIGERLALPSMLFI